MTAQIQDCYRHKGNEYSLVALSSPIGFNPKDYGLTPNMYSTACWNGYWCTYEITDEELRLKDLYIYNKNGDYPAFCGVQVSLPGYFYPKYKGKTGKLVTEKTPKNQGHRVYRDVNLPISYTGRILLGSDFINNYLIHMGYQRSWTYKVLLEYVFIDGLLMEINDLSDEAKKQRMLIDKGIKLPTSETGKLDDLEDFVEGSFSLDYKDKAWWIKDI